jgi:hypothetical protein
LRRKWEDMVHSASDERTSSRTRLSRLTRPMSRGLDCGESLESALVSGGWAIRRRGREASKMASSRRSGPPYGEPEC